MFLSKSDHEAGVTLLVELKTLIKKLNIHKNRELGITWHTQYASSEEVPRYY